MSTKNKIDFAALLAKVKANAEGTPSDTATLDAVVDSIDLHKIPAQVEQVTGMHGELITYNDKQQEFIDLASAGRSCVLIGACHCK